MIADQADEKQRPGAAMLPGSQIVVYSPGSSVPPQIIGPAFDALPTRTIDHEPAQAEQLGLCRLSFPSGSGTAFNFKTLIICDMFPFPISAKYPMSPQPEKATDLIRGPMGIPAIHKKWKML